jgi:hypothetical protein
MGRPSLGKVFAAIVGSVAGAGCADPRIDVDDFDDECDTPLLATLRPAAPFDSIEIRGIDGDSQKSGTPCGAAADKGACEAARRGVVIDQSELRTGQARSQGGTRPAVVIVTTGDEVRLIDTRAKLATFLGPVDSASDARLAAMVAGFPSCRVRPAGVDWDIYSETHGSNCDTLGLNEGDAGSTFGAASPA